MPNDNLHTYQRVIEIEVIKNCKVLKITDTLVSQRALTMTQNLGCHIG